MPTTRDHDLRHDRIARLLEHTIKNLGPELVGNPQLAEVLNRMVDEQIRQADADQGNQPPPPDGGFADLLGIGSAAAPDMGRTYTAPGVPTYDEKLISERLIAASEVYSICIHERLGVFRVMDKLKELFDSGSLRISSGPGAYGLYRYDKRGILRYPASERYKTYKRLFGYTSAALGPNARANSEFHGLFTHFIAEAAKFWRDKRISEVIRDRATDPTFGSMAIVKRAGLDLRNNLKNSSYGNINVLRIEANQMLAEAFAVLESPDILTQFGAENAWDVIELVLWQYFHETVHASTMSRMAVSGSAILGWLAQPYILIPERVDFEAMLLRIAESAEEWISSEEGIRMSRPTPPPRNIYVQGLPPPGPRR